jgi:beta-1,4-mannooligosaccharide/beta-1,4-mannosyl-N-acetylglucosamine phosphorylase
MNTNMNNKMIIGADLPKIPWEERPDGCIDIVWRSVKNPIIKNNQLPNTNSIFNSAIISFKESFLGVFRCDDKTLTQNLYLGESKDGVKWEISEKPISLIGINGEDAGFISGYDPRVCRIEDRYYITWCNNFHGPTIGVAYTYDFHEFCQLENAFLPYNRNGVLFPRKINGKYVMLSRPSDKGHTPFGDIFLSESPDMVHWGCHRFVMEAKGGWAWTKIGAGPIPIETTQGWLMIFHGVMTTCSGMVYSMGAALLDRDEPWKVLYRAKPYILHPVEIYERTGDVPNVVFPCATLQDAATGRIAIYYGAADTVVCVAYTQVDELIKFIKINS